VRECPLQLNLTPARTGRKIDGLETVNRPDTGRIIETTGTAKNEVSALDYPIRGRKGTAVGGPDLIAVIYCEYELIRQEQERRWRQRINAVGGS